MDQETTHVRVSRATQERLTALSNATGIHRYRLADDILIAAVESIENGSAASLDLVSKLRNLLGLDAAAYEQRIEKLENSIAELSKEAYKPRARK